MAGKFSIESNLGKWKKGDLPVSCNVWVILSSFARDKEGWPHLTQDMASDGEVDEVINSLIKELEGVRKEAKRALKKGNDKVRTPPQCRMGGA